MILLPFSATKLGRTTLAKSMICIPGIATPTEAYAALNAGAAALKIFPAELVETFEPVVHEEGRHILFFANWVAWHRRRLNIFQRIAFELKVAAVWVFLAYERMGIASGMDDAGDKQKDKVKAKQAADANFTVTGASSVGEDLDVWELMALCLEENDRRLGVYDKRLVRPMFMPTMVRLALAVMRRKPKRAKVAALPA